jgi:hypothetical protein
MTAGSDTPAKSSTTGAKPNASRQPAKSRESALQTWLATSLTPRAPKYQRRLNPEDIHARLIFIIGIALSTVFVIISLGITYALIFVTQPIGSQAPNDAAFIDLLKTMAIFLTGALGGVLAGNGLKSKPKLGDTPNPEHKA